MSNSKYQAYLEHMRKLADIEGAIAVLSWDRETNLPEKGARFRSQQVSTLSALHHDIATDPALDSTLRELESIGQELDPQQRKNITLTREDLEKSKKFDTAFVRKRSQIISEAYHAWLQAREADDYQVFEPHMGRIVDLKQQEAEKLGYDESPYDALLDTYEPKYKSAQLDQLFADVKEQLVPFVADIRSRQQVDDSFLHQPYDKDQQWQLGLELLEKIGYDFKAGRQDKSPHPFTITFSPEDVRVTTMLSENNFSTMCWSCIHEGGHALYEQGLSPEHYGLPTGRAISLGIHESQSRLWENNVGRGMPFWKAHYPMLQRYFPEQLGQVKLEDFYKAINKIYPHPIRIESDELHYHFHVMIRYEIEKGLIEGSIATKDVPAEWKQRYKDYLDLDITSDKEGCLQDIHWSNGGIGYFPTYSLGSFYAAQLYAQAQADIPSLEQQIEQGNTQILLDWLRNKIHKHGRFYTADELCQKITGESLDFSYFMRYAKEKYAGIYGV